MGCQQSKQLEHHALMIEGESGYPEASQNKTGGTQGSEETEEEGVGSRGGSNGDDDPDRVDSDGQDDGTIHLDQLQIRSQPTPLEIRMIREELFHETSTLVVPAASTLHMISSVGSTSFSEGDIRFLDDGINNNNSGAHSSSSNNNNNRELMNRFTSDSNPTGQTSHTGQASRTNTHYHYPQALYEKMKSVQHFVPTSTSKMSNAATNSSNTATTTGTTGTSSQLVSATNSAETDQQGNTTATTNSILKLVSGSTTNGASADELGFSNRSSIISGLSQLDLSEQSLKGFPQFDALVDTMALALEPQQQNPQVMMAQQQNLLQQQIQMQLQQQQQKPFGNLVDTLSEEEFLLANGTTYSCDGDDETAAAADHRPASSGFAACRAAGGGGALRETMLNFAHHSAAMASQGRGRPPIPAPLNAMAGQGGGCGRPPLMPIPVLEQKMSSEILADMKTMALLAEVTDKSSSLFLTAEPSMLPANQQKIDCSCTGESGEKPSSLLKYHRSTSVTVPTASGSMSVCSELGSDWM